ncbi:ABC-F family ATP-binding cassette domain-containing protein [Demequina subtropica]|uniref:ABC-F family ATP-binding cassette domain-containing protein n=1 Tax=Demequina subtropica TaxID=1638989 RepID=UPI000780A620|nr:ABC-F family ATP-binding cassette domain-containing protein [Demequina subtropica]
MAHLLGAEALHLDFGTGPVLNNMTVGLDDGDRIGMVGTNGAGKSTLLKVLAGRVEPDDGRVTVARGTRIGVLDQSDHVDESLTVAQAIVGDRDEHEWAGDPRVRDIMSGLVPDLPADAVVGDLSGGQQRRVALAHVLVGDHDVVFLDEPTNHLDVEGVTWLADHLKRRWTANKGALLVVTHDRWFLDEISTKTWEVHDGEVDMYEGGYAAYVLQRVERDRIAAVTEQRRQNLMRKELAWLRRGAPARTSKPKFRIDAANALIADVPPIRDTVKLHRMAAARLGKDVVELVNVGVSYGDKEVLRHLDFNIGPGDRIGILGENGAGKSTFLRLVTGEQEPTSGRVKTGMTVRVEQLSQQLAELDDIADERVSAVVKRYASIKLSDGQEMTPSQLLERMGFTSIQLKTPVGRLSGGQRRRLQLLVVLLSEPNVLVLDEPTNDLDTDMLAALEDLLDSWPGTLIVVSHDRYLMERITDQQYAVVDGGLRHLPGGVDEYVAMSRERRAAGSSGIGTFGVGGDDAAATVRAAFPDAVATPASSGEPELSGAERRAVEKELKAAERRMAKIQELTEGLHNEMVMHDQSDFAGLARYMKELQALEGENAELEERWLELTEQLG